MRFVKNNAVHEVFLGFEELQATTGLAIADKLLQTLSFYGLDLEKLRGQGYDGCASMKGHVNGVQARIKRLYPTAVYTHCASHVLDLAVSKVSCVAVIANCLSTVKDVTTFVRSSAKRMMALKQNIETARVASTNTSLTSLCETRWVDRHKNVAKFLDMFPTVTSTLEEISVWPDTTAAAKASQYLCALLSSKFIVALCVCARFSRLLLPISKVLQTANFDLVQCTKEVRVVQEVVRDYRDNANSEFHVIFSQAQALSQVPISIPRKTGRQLNRANYDTNDPETFYRQAMYLPYVDGLLQELRSRFNDHFEVAARIHMLVPSKAVSTYPSDLQETVEFYKNDIHYDAVFDEFARWKIKWEQVQESERPENAIDAVAAIESQKEFYPSIYNLLKILATIPVTTASAERTFSCLRRLKTYLRSAMGEDRLSGLAHMQIHRDKVPNADVVLDELAKKKRKLDFLL